MSGPNAPTILCLSSYFKGNAFLKEAKRLGCRVLLLTREAMLGEPWARESIDEVFGMPTLFDRTAVIHAVSYLARTRTIDRVAPLDDFDVELACSLREHMRIPGMGDTTARYFRDKLAMRQRCQDRGVAVPEFVQVLNHERVARFFGEVPGPWLIKPRSSANSFGIQKFTDPEEAWRRIHELGDDQSHWLLERYVPGDVCHVDGIISAGKVVFAEAHQYRRPLMDVAKGGGIFATRTLERDSPEARELRAMHEAVVGHFGLQHGVTHMEFIRAHHDRRLYFLETAARVGGAHIYDVVEAATGVNLWAEWAKIELGQGAEPYTLPATRRDHGACILALAREAHPDTSSFQDPEIAWPIAKKNHIGFILRSPSPQRIEELLERYEQRIGQEFLAVLPEAAP